MATLFAAFLLLAQNDQTIFRTEKDDYTTSIQKCKDAEELLESDPQGAIARLDDILSNPKLRKIECRVRIENRSSEYSAWYLFLPCQYRGRARMNLAKKSDNETAQKLVTGAVQDFQTSAGKNVATSEKFLKTAQAELDKLKATAAVTPVDPLLKFRAAWDPLLQDNRFKSARTLINSDGKALTDEQQKNFAQTVEKRCQDFLVAGVASLRPKFIGALRNGVGTLTPEEFDLAFALPSSEELLVSHPVIDWLRNHLPTLRDLQAGKVPGHALATAAVEAVPLEERLVNPWFQAVENVVFDSLRAAISAEVETSRNAPQADREKSRSRVQALLAQWKMLLGKLDAKFVERHHFVTDHEDQLLKLPDGFPGEIAELERSEKELDALFGADAHEAELVRIERELEAHESRTNVTRESRGRLATARIVVATLRGLLAGKSEEALVGELGGWRQKLRDAGGAVEPAKYGPRVAKVFEGLR
jgi:hypothetical protein